MPQIPALTSFTASTLAQAAQVNSNFSNVRTYVNTYGVFTDVASQIVTKTLTFTPDSGAAITVTTGGIGITAGGLTITAGGATITAGGLTVSAGGAAITGNSTITGTLTALTGITSSGTASLATVTVSNNIQQTGGQNFTQLYDAGNSSTSKTIDWNNGNLQKVTMTGNCTFTFSNPQTGAYYTLLLVQDGTGSRTAVWPATVKWAGATTPTLTTTASRTDVVTFLWDGTRYISSPVSFSHVA
jgi:hypothetical protein